MDLVTVWFALVVLCWVLFFALEGFDFGVGMLAPLLGRTEHERAAAVRTVGEQVRGLLDVGMDGLTVNLPTDGHDPEAVAFAGEVLGKALG